MVAWCIDHMTDIIELFKVVTYLILIFYLIDFYC